MKRTKFPTQNNCPKVDDAPIREAQFIYEYIVDFNLEKAAERAGAISSEDTSKTRQATVRNLLFRTYHELIDKIQDRVARIKLTNDKDILELVNVAYADPMNLFDDSGQPLPLSNIPANVRRTISEINFKTTKDGTVYPSKVKFYDKMQALQILLKQGSLGPDNVNYNYNQYNQYNAQQINQINLTDLSNNELQGVRQALGDRDPQEVLDLQRLEQNV